MPGSVHAAEAKHPKEDVSAAASSRNIGQRLDAALACLPQRKQGQASYHAIDDRHRAVAQVPEADTRDSQEHGSRNCYQHDSGRDGLPAAGWACVLDS